VQQPAVGVGIDVDVEIEVDLRRTQHRDLEDPGEAALGMIIIRNKGIGLDVAGMVAQGAHSVEVEALAVEDIAGEAVLEHIDHIPGRPAADEIGHHARLVHEFAHIFDKGERNPAGAGLKAEMGIGHEARLADKAGGILGDEKTGGRTGDLGRARDDLARVADGVDHHDIIDVAALDAPGMAGKIHKVIGHHHHLVGEERVGQSEAERAAGGGAVDAVGVAMAVGAGRRDESDIDVEIAVLEGAVAAAMRAQHRGLFHFAQRAGAADGAVHRALNMGDHAGFDMVGQPAVNREKGRRGEHQIFQTARGQLLHHQVDEEITVAQMMMKRDHHAVADLAGVDRRIEVSE